MFGCHGQKNTNISLMRGKEAIRINIKLTYNYLIRTAERIMLVVDQLSFDKHIQEAIKTIANAQTLSLFYRIVSSCLSEWKYVSWHHHKNFVVIVEPFPIIIAFLALRLVFKAWIMNISYYIIFIFHVHASCKLTFLQPHTDLYFIEGN